MCAGKIKVKDIKYIQDTNLEKNICICKSMLLLSKVIAVTKKDNMKYITIRINLYLQECARAEIGDCVV